jgi:hypothetical protein
MVGDPALIVEAQNRQVAGGATKITSAIEV